MVNGNCAVVSCKNSNYKLKNWKKEACLVHLGQTHESCPCPRSFTLHRFPSAKVNAERRKEWIRLMNRTTARKTAWTPGQSDLVCSCHFVDGMPTLQNPDPTLKLGYTKKNPEKKTRRELIRRETKKASEEPKEPSGSANEGETSNAPAADSNLEQVLQETQHCKGCEEKSSLIGALIKGVKTLAHERDELKSKVEELSSELRKAKCAERPLSWTNIKTNAKMKFYTGISTILLFSSLFDLIKPCLPNLIYCCSFLLQEQQSLALRESRKLARKINFC